MMVKAFVLSFTVFFSSPDNPDHTLARTIPGTYGPWATEAFCEKLGKAMTNEGESQMSQHGMIYRDSHFICIPLMVNEKQVIKSKKEGPTVFSDDIVG